MPNGTPSDGGLYAMPGHLIRRCQQIAVALFVEETERFDLTPVQYAALVSVRENPGIDQVGLVGRIALDRSSAADPWRHTQTPSQKKKKKIYKVKEK